MSKIARAVKKHGGQSAVARELGCSREFVRQLVMGECTPGLALAFKIQELLDVPVTYWKDAATAHGSGEPT
jgi:transcriptional regulator with XRE-family HTH domain